MVPLLTGLDAAGWAAIATAGLAGVTVLQLIAFLRSEGRRTQPVVILNRDAARNMQREFGVSFENRGTGTAYNVRGGVRLDGTEYPLGEGDGNRYTVAAGERVPRPQHILGLRVPHWPYMLARGGRDVDSRAVFYARYENAYGSVWETLNPVDPSASFRVRKAWLFRLRNWRQRRRRASDERIAKRRLAEEAEALRTGQPLPLRRRVLRRLGR